MNVNCGGNALEFDGLVADGTVKKSSVNGVEYYHFPSLSIDKDTGYHDIEKVEKNKAITDEEHSDVTKGMAEFEKVMSKQLGDGAVGHHMGDGPIVKENSSGDDEVPRVQLRDTLKLDACSTEQMLKKLQRSSAVWSNRPGPLLSTNSCHRIANVYKKHKS